MSDGIRARAQQLLSRAPLLGRRFQGHSATRPHGYDLLGELHEDLDPESLPSPKQQVAHAALLESLRALDTVLDVPTVVIAGVSTADSARSVIAGLIIQAHLSGLHMSLGKLVQGKGFRMLRKRVSRSEPGEDTRAPGSGNPEDLALQIVGAPDPTTLRDWYHRAAEGSDLLLVEAPPMLKSADAALLGRACDGLVLVARTLRTRQEAFEVAVDRARAAGSPPIGLVMDHHQDWLPRVIRKILPAYPRTFKRRRGS